MNMSSDKICGICFEDLGHVSPSTGKRQTRTTPCTHSFHAGCIEIWLQNKRLCPMCRTPIPYTDVDGAIPVGEPTDDSWISTDSSSISIRLDNSNGDVAQLAALIYEAGPNVLMHFLGNSDVSLSDLEAIERAMNYVDATTAAGEEASEQVEAPTPPDANALDESEVSVQMPVYRDANGSFDSTGRGVLTCSCRSI